MESEQSVQTSPPNYDVEMSEQDMARWLLRLKYSAILRRRLGVSQSTRRRLLGNHSNRTTSYLHLKVLFGLAASAYFLARDKNTPCSSVLDVDCDENDLQCKMTARDVKAVLRHRGISAESFFEKKDLEILSARSGLVNDAELKSALAYDDYLENFNSTCDREAMFYRSLISSEFSMRQHNMECNEENIELKTTVFDSSGLFIDRLEDNKESIWMLSVISSDPNSPQTVNPAIWSRLVRHFSPISIKFGILLCDKLENICSEYGFTPSILAIVLPVSLPNRKQSVEFRRLSLAHAPLCNDITSRGRKGCVLLLDHITNLLQNFLSQRITPLRSISQIQSLKSTRPQVLNMIWIPGERFCNQSYPLSNSDHQVFARPPLAFSILAISYLGRAAFWRLDAPHPPPSQSEFTQEVSPQTSSVEEMLQQLGCALGSGQWGGHSRYVLLTPEGRCFVQYRFSFKRLDNLLRWNFPSSNDLFFFGLFVINTVLIVAAIFQFLLSLRLLHLIFSRLIRLINRNSSKTQKDDDKQGARRPLKVRTKLITSVVKATFSGWKNYTPVVVEDPDSNRSQQSSRMQRLISICEQALTSLFGMAFRLFLANLLFLLAALPIVNLMGHALPLAGILLHSLRSIVFWFGLAAITPTSLTVLLILKIVACAFVLIAILEASNYWIRRKFVGKWKYSNAYAHSPAMAPAKIDPFVAKLYKMNCAAVALNSPILLARYLVLSDDEFSMESPQQSSSSISDAETHREPSAETPSLRAFEAARLYRKAIELDKTVAMASKQSHLTWQATQNIILNRDDGSPGPKFPAKLFVWKFTAGPSLSSKVPESRPSHLKPKSVSPRFAVESRDRDEDKCYEAGSESDRSPQTGHSSLALGRQRRSRRPGIVNASEPRLHWPSWVITCEECVVCWREFESGTIMAALSCGHAFHAECLKSWLDVGRDCCPVCRWPAHLSHNQREKHLICQLIRALRVCLRSARNTGSNSSSSSSETEASTRR